MESSNRRTILALALGIVSSARAQMSFQRPVSFVATAAPGGVTDTLARGLAQHLAPMWGQPIVVENRPGANNIIGASHVAKAAPDGTTFLVAEASTFVINPSLYKQLPYDVARDFTPITTIASTSNVIVVPASLGVDTLGEFISRAKAQPGALSFGSTGVGSFAHIAGEQLCRMAGIQLTHVAYKGGAPLRMDLLTGRIAMYIAHISSAMKQHSANGRLRMLAAATTHRLPLFPAVPTASEAGIPGFNANTWFGLLAPAKLTPAVLNKVHADVVAVIRSSRFQADCLAPDNLDPFVQLSPDAFREHIVAETARWKPVIVSSGATVE